MKKLLIFSLLILGAYSCIKKKALKYDPGLVGTWVSKEDSVYTWLIINADGMGDYSTEGNNEASAKGEVKYSVFERKMWVGHKKFKVTVWRPAALNGVDRLATKEKETLKDTTYFLEERMVLKTTELVGRRTITFYKVRK